MSVTVSFRVSKELKKKMDELRGIINWSDELRKFVERRIKEYEQIKAIEELDALVRRLPEAPRGTATRYVREDRDSN